MIIISVALISSFIVLAIVYSWKAITVMIPFLHFLQNVDVEAILTGTIYHKRRKRNRAHLIGENILTRL